MNGPVSSCRSLVTDKRKRLFGARVVLWCFGLMAGCGEQPIFTDKHTAEENGYLFQLGTAFSATCQVGTIQPRQITPVITGVKIDWLADTGINVSDVSALLGNTLAPEGLSEAQDLLAQTLLFEIRRDPRVTKQAEATCKAFNAYEESVSARATTFTTTDSLYITYVPPAKGLPGIQYNTRSGLGFALDTSVTVPTPYGSVTAGYKAPPGIHMLRVVSDGKQRFLTLDRPFEFYIPQGHSVRVVFQGKDELILEVTKS